MLEIKLAIRNLLGAGLRTWLNVFVLSFAFIFILFYNGILDGWNEQARNDTQAWEIASGQFWTPGYDPYDPYSLQDAHTPLSAEAQRLVAQKQLVPVLITQATAYPQGRVESTLLKGIDPDQETLQLPTEALKSSDNGIPAIIGRRMAESCNLKENDVLLVRWRDRNGTFDAREVRIAKIFKTNVPAVDNAQIWIPLAMLQEMTAMPNEATLLVRGNNTTIERLNKWEFKDDEFLLKDIDDVIKYKRNSARIIYLLLLSIALLAIFDSQVLSVFRRQREIGTYIALGMTRWQVVRIFTIEGALHSVFSLVLAAVYGIPLLAWLHKVGLPMPQITDSTGLAIAEKLVPTYSLGLIVSTIVLVVISSTIVSYFPTRRISKMKPTDALKGKLQ